MICNKEPKLLNIKYSTDSRGDFFKPYHTQSIEDQLGFDFQIKEVFYTHSACNVFRGFHFQHPPMSQSKLVSCMAGRVLDILIDIRQGPTFKNIHTFELDSKKKHLLFIPHGFAHGFISIDPVGSMMSYMADQVYSAEFESGLHFSSYPSPTAKNQFIISDRDLSFRTLDEFKTPFIFSRK